MADAITIQALQDARLDAKSLEEVVNGNESKQVTTRLGESYPSVKKAIKTLFENGGLPAVPFATKALMSASALVDGDYAMVTDDTDDINGLYIKEGGIWAKSKYDVANITLGTTYKAISEALKDVQISETENLTLNNRKLVFAFTDKDDKLGVAFTEDGSIISSNITIEDSIFSHVFTDSVGRVVIAIDGKTGHIYNSQINDLEKGLADVKQEIENKEDTITSVAKLRENVADYMHVFSYGQSLSRGSHSNPVVSTSQPYYNVTFNSGVLIRPNDINFDASTFKPLVEQTVGGEGETPISGLLNEFVRLQVEDGQDAQNWRMVGSSPGLGGTPIIQLSKGTMPYNAFVDEVEAAYGIAQNEGRTYNVWAIAWTQGETDYNLDTTKETYMYLLEKLRGDLYKDIKPITGQNFAPPWIMYQTTSHRNYGKDTMQIPLAQLELSNKVDDIILATPIYHIPHWTDHLHMTADSSVHLGKYYAIALDKWYKGEKHEPLKPVNVITQSRLIDITFNQDGLVFDTVLVNPAINMGFDIRDADDNVLDIINNVELINNRVRITLSSDLTEGCKLTYARGRPGDPATGGPIDGPRGNLRDTAGDNNNYQDSQGSTRYMHNWCVHFEQSL